MQWNQSHLYGRILTQNRLFTYVKSIQVKWHLVTEVSRQIECDWLDKIWLDCRLDVDLAIDYDWRRVLNNVTGDGI